MRDLGVLGRRELFDAYGLNLNGDVVGQAKISLPCGLVIAPMSGSTSGSMRDLNSMIPSGTGWRPPAAHAISDDAKIVGYGARAGRRGRSRRCRPRTARSAARSSTTPTATARAALSEAVLSRPWCVFLDADKDGAFDAGEAYARRRMRTAIGPSKNLPAGTFSVRVIKSGWKPTAPAGGSFSISVSTGGVVTGRNFGLASG